MANGFYSLSDTLLPLAAAGRSTLAPDMMPPETSGPMPFMLGQNYPNPFLGETTVPFALTFAADVQLSVFDPQGRKVAGVVRKGRGPGPQSIKLNLSGLGLAPGDYMYQMQIVSRQGIFRQSKVMTTL